MEAILEIGLFAITPQGTSIIGHSRDPDLVEAVRQRIAREKRAALAQLIRPDHRRLELVGEAQPPEAGPDPPEDVCRR